MTKESKIELGCFASNGIIEGEVVNIGVNYATLVVEGNEHRIWLKDLKRVDGQQKRSQLYKESFIYKGYQTRNINRALAEHFKNIAKENEDTYGVLRCIKAVDNLLETTETDITEDFNDVKAILEQTKKYLDKFGWHPVAKACFDVISETCLKYSILEGVRYTTTDPIMVARMISSIAEIPAKGIDPISIVNAASIKLKNLQLTPQGWELVGRILNVATDVGIKWNKQIFNEIQQRQMELK